MSKMKVKFKITGKVGVNYGRDGTMDVVQGETYIAESLHEKKVADIWVNDSIAEYVLMKEGGGQLSTDAEEDESVKDEPKAGSIEEALLMLDPANDEHWTNAGLPAMKVVEDLIGDPSIKRKDVDKAGGPDFDREQAIELALSTEETEE